MRCAQSEQDNASLTALIKELRSTPCLGDLALSVGVGMVVVLLLLEEFILIIGASDSFKNCIYSTLVLDQYL